jgi:hypothetical protein
MTIRVFASGQSNMLGRGSGGPSLSGVSANVRVWNNVNPLGSNGSAFVTAAQAQAAGTFELTDRNNLAVWFCDKLARRRFDTVDLTLVARASSGIQLWSPNEESLPMLAECQSVWAATGQGPADVFLWHQGENNVATPVSSYQAAFEALVANLKSSGVISDSTVIIVGGILDADAQRNAFNRTALVPISRRARRGYARSHGLTSGDGAHFDGASLAALGARRYFSAYLFAEGY